MSREDAEMRAVFDAAKKAARDAVGEYLAECSRKSVDPEWGLNCGFAWVHMAANQPFVRWCVRQQKALGFKIDSAGNVVRLSDGKPATGPEYSAVKEYGGRGYPKAGNSGTLGNTTTSRWT